MTRIESTGNQDFYPVSQDSGQQKVQQTKTPLASDQKLIGQLSHKYGIDGNTITAMVTRGELLINTIKLTVTTTKEWNEFIENNASPENAVYLIWALMAKSGKHGDYFTKGSCRLSNGALVEKFLIACGKKDPKYVSYKRISTHMLENLQEGQSQYGLDIDKLKDQNGMELCLPAKAKTILFVKQPDGSLFYKLEEHGLGSLIGILGHSLSYTKTRIEKWAGYQVKGATKEHVPKKIKKEFKKTIATLYPPGKPSFFEKLFGIKPKLTGEGKRLYEEGKKFGISKMKEILMAEMEKGHQDKTVIKNMLKAHIDPVIEAAEKRGYKGTIKGNEIRQGSIFNAEFDKKLEDIYRSNIQDWVI